MNGTTFVIFGATGDLALRKILPSLLNMQNEGILPSEFQIIAYSRRPWSDAEYRNFALKEAFHGVSETTGLGEFLARISFIEGQFDDFDSYGRLGMRLLELDRRIGKCANKLFYLAVPPAHYETILKNLSKSGLTVPCSDKTGWTRLLVEKPFGEDLASAKRLETMLSKLFKEEQVFRIDHYLAKETIQNILVFRFANLIYEPVWSAKYIEEIKIMLYESGALGKRTNFINRIGTLRDVGQNHILQMLAIITMEEPKELSAKTVRQNRARVLKSLKPVTAKSVGVNVLRAQYSEFPEESGDPGSATETFFRVKAYSNLKRWKGVPFVLEAGKLLSENKAEIVVKFKQSPLPAGFNGQNKVNELVFKIQPDEGISASFLAKKSGVNFELEKRTMEFKYKKGADNKSYAYEKVLYDCIRGDQTLFASSQEVEASWKFIMSVMGLWNKLPLIKYEKGSSAEDINLIAQNQ